MAPEAEPAARADPALQPFPPGPLLEIARGGTVLTVAPLAGGRIAQVVHAGLPWLVEHGPQSAAMIAWGCYPMVPWAGRLRGGRLVFEGRQWRIPATLGAHAIHGVGFALPWEVEAHGGDHLELSLQLPRDARWPFGGMARQRMRVEDGRVELSLSLSAQDQAMPAVLGWHPWFLKPDRIEFAPEAMYPRDAEGIAVGPPVPPTPPPWDDCFIMRGPVVVHRGGHHLRLESDCRHWVVYDVPAHASCIEPQTGPPDGPNLEPDRIAPGATRHAWFSWQWR